MPGAQLKKLLLVSYFFPPFGGAGVQRALKLSRAAPAMGWTVPAVVSAEPGPSEARDPTLLSEIPEDCQVLRPTVLRPGGLSRWVGPWMSPDPYLGWLSGAIAAARAAVIEHAPDAILSTSMPYTAHLVARAIKRETGLPWVADLRDPWTDNRFLGWYDRRKLSGRFRHWSDGAMERSVYAEADLVTVTAAPLAELLRHRHGVAAAKVLLARNGYDEEDFAGLLPMPQPRPPRDRQALRILFAGSIYQGYTFEPFLAALEALLEKQPAAPIRFDVVTSNPGLYQNFSANYPRAKAVTTLGGRVTHAEVIERYAQADLLVLSCLDDLSIPGKLFEYIRSGTAVLAFAVPGAEAWALLGDTGAGHCAPADDPARGAEMLEQLLALWQAGQPLAQPQPDAVQQLERRVEYQKIFSRLDELVGQRLP